MPLRKFSVFTLIVVSVIPSLAQVPLNVFPSRIVGHPVAEQNGILANYNPNLVEGRELFTPAGLALDTSVSPPILYVADTGNNRVLAWKDAVNFTNGRPADMVIGQIDFYRTIPQGPSATFQTGLSLPTGLAVYKKDLYVVDSGNNRVLRFPSPFDNAGNLFPDLFIGQPSLGSNAANFNGKTAAQGLSLSTSSGGAYQANIAFDKDGNLWMTDPGNRRVLQFRAADVAAGGGPLTAALEIGQSDFDSVQAGVNSSNRTALNLFAIPAGIAIDPASGRLFVSDADTSTFNSTTEFSPNQVARVLVFQPPFSNGMAAARALGVVPQSSDQITLDFYSKSSFSDPEGIFILSNGQVGVVDSRRGRILMFDAFEKWPAVSTSFSPQAIAVIGQKDFTSVGRNAATSTYIPKPAAGTFNQPSAVAIVGTDMYLADSYNHRILAGPFQGTSFAATRVLGQDRFDMSAPNLIEGREFYFLNIDLLTGTRSAEAGVAIDTSSDPPHLYVADTFNHRVLGFKDYRKVQAGAKADIVIGQPDFSSGLCNVSGDPNGMNNATLCLPTGLLVDSNGNLYVADTQNGRVLRFPNPFGPQGVQAADFVLGQRNFTSKVTQPGPNFMSGPYGLAFAGTTGLLVSDTTYNRVLFFPYHAGATTFDNTDIGKNATKVFGQPDFFTTNSGTTANRFNSPRHIATDSETHLFVADTGNSRVSVFDQVTSTLTPNQDAVATIQITGLSSPRGVWVNQVTTGEVWVTDSASSQALTRKYASYQTLVFDQSVKGLVQSALNPLAVTQDQFGNLVIADASNRIGVYVPQVQSINGANFLAARPLAPGVLASLCSPGSNCNPQTRANMFGSNTAVFDGNYPMPTTLGDVQVRFNDQPVPLYVVTPSQINFVVPMSAPNSGPANLEVIQPSTGRILAAGQPTMNSFSPGLLTPSFETTVNQQAAVINVADGTVNTTTNGAARGTYVEIFGTGQGFVPNAPPDGALVTQAYPALVKPGVFLNANDLMSLDRGADEPDKSQWIQYSGLSQFPGVWQINIYIPKAIPPGSQTPLAVVLGGLVNYDGQTSGAHRTTIAIK